APWCGGSTGELLWGWERKLRVLPMQAGNQRDQNSQGTRGRQLLTTSLPNGATANGIICSDAQAMASPRMVTANPSAVVMWRMVSHHPATITQMTLRAVLPPPAPLLRTRSRPKGQKA